MKQYTINKKYQQFNDFLRGELHRQNITQKQVSIWLNISPSCVSDRINGRKEWTVKEILSLCELMGKELELNKKEVRLCESRTSQIKDL